MEQTNPESNAPSVDQQPTGSAASTIPTLSEPLDAKKSAPKRRGWALVVVYFFMIVLALAGGAGGYYLLQQQQMSRIQQQTDLQRMTGVIEQKDRAIEQLHVELRQIALTEDQKQQRLMSRLEQMQKLQTSQQSRLQALSASDKSDWLLAEVEYLLRLANQRLLMGEDLAGADSLLTTADKIIRELDDMGLFALRQAIASDLVAVRAVDHVDVQGAYARISALVAQVDKLPLFTPPDMGEKRQEQHRSDVQSDEASWYGQAKFQLKAAWRKFSAALGIHYRDYQVEPLLSSEQHFYLRQNMRLMLEQARSALLTGRQAIYQNSLQRAREWLAKYFQLAGQPAQAAITELDQLLKLDIMTEVPDISESLRVLKVYENDRLGKVQRAAKTAESTKDARLESERPSLAVDEKGAL